MHNLIIKFMKKLFLLFVIGSFACTKHADISQKQEATASRTTDTKKTEQLFSAINENYKPNYLEEGNFKAKVKRDKPQEYFTVEGNKIHFELMSLVENSKDADLATLEVNHLRIQDKLKSAVNLPDHQRLVVTSGSKLIARRLINAKTDREKELLFLYTKNLVEEQCTNYYLLYESFSKVRNESNKAEISSLVKRTLSIDYNPSIKEPATTSSQQVFYDSVEKGYQYKGLYKKRLEEFL